MIDRAAVHKLIESPRAADQFLYQALHRGLLVPISWGRALVPDSKTLRVLEMVPDPAWARIISHARAISMNLGSSDHTLLGFLAPFLLGIVDAELIESTPVYDLAGATRMRDPPLRKDAFHVDSLNGRHERARVQIGAHTVMIPIPPTSDVVRILQSTLEPRLSVLAARLLADAPPKDHQVLRDTRPRWAIPAPIPNFDQSLPTGPPQNLRLFGPTWYLDILRGVQDAQTRQRFQHA